MKKIHTKLFLGDQFGVCIDERTTATCTRAIRNSPFRTVNGVCNNLKEPTLGSTRTALRRLLRKSNLFNIIYSVSKVPNVRYLIICIKTLIHLCNQGNDHIFCMAWISFLKLQIY